MHNSTVTFQKGSHQIQKSQNLTQFLIGHFLRLYFFTNYGIYNFHTMDMVFIGDLANIRTINSTNTVGIREI